MHIKKIVIIFFTFIFILFLSLVIYFKFIKVPKEIIYKKNENKDTIYNSNIISDVNYTTKDSAGNEYIVNALQGEIDFSNTKILFLTDVNAVIKLNTLIT